VGRIVHHGKFWLAMSALDQKRTSQRISRMSAFPESGHSLRQSECPFWADTVAKVAKRWAMIFSAKT
jgi:hypothetical protein